MSKPLHKMQHTSEKGGGKVPPLIREKVRVYPMGAGTKECKGSGVTKDAVKGLGIKRK